jgi:hypothetical protein
MSAPFRIYRILGSTPPDLEMERLVFESALATFGEHVTFPQHVLFAGASFRDLFDASRNPDAVEANVRMCDFFLHIFSDTWPGPAFKEYIDLAQACKEDPTQPMRQVAILFKTFAAAGEEVRKYRDTLAADGKCDLRDFEGPAELERVLREIFATWWERVQSQP